MAAEGSGLFGLRTVGSRIIGCVVFSAFRQVSDLVEVSFSVHVVTAHCNSRRRKKIVETKVVKHLEANNFS